MTRVRFLLVMGVLALASAPPARCEAPGRGPCRPGSSNLVVHVSGTLIDAAMRRPVDRLEPFEDVIRDTYVAGLRRTQATVRAELIPDPCHAVVDVVLGGCTRAQGVGFRSLVRIFTFTATPFEARERIVIDNHGVRAYPVPAHASAKLTLLGITDRHGETDTTATDFARIGFRKDQDEAEAEISVRAAQTTGAQLHLETGPSVNEVYRAVNQGLGGFKRAGLTLEGLCFSTTPDRLEARLRIATPGLPGPAADSPQPAAADLHLAIHQSLVNAAARVALGGKTYLLSELRERVDALTDRYLRDPRADSDRATALKALEKYLAALGGEQPTITLAQEDPLSVAFTGPGLTVEVHVAEMRWAGKSFAGMRVRATYRLDKTAWGRLTIRRAPLRFRVPDNDPEANKPQEPATAALRLVQEAYFDQLIKEHLTLADLPRPATVSRLGPLAVSARMRDGWLILEWKLKQGAKCRLTPQARP